VIVGLRRCGWLAQGPRANTPTRTRRRHARGLTPRRRATAFRTTSPIFLSDEMHGWLNKMVMIATTHMMLMAEVLGYDTAPMEGFEQEKVHEVLRLPLSYWVVALLAIGHLKGPDKFYGGRFEMGHTVFGEEFGSRLK